MTSSLPKGAAMRAIVKALATVCVVLLHAVPAGAADDRADQVYVRGSIWTGDAQIPHAVALAVRGDRIIAVGSQADVQPLITRRTEIVDLGGARILPGLIDNHTHFIDGGLSLRSVQLRDVASRGEFARRIADAAAKAEPEEWILYGSWDHELWGGELPHREWIDKAAGTVPVFVYRYDGHMALANTVALQRAGIGERTANPTGGSIVRDAQGRATGVLKDTAMELVQRVIRRRARNRWTRP